MVRLAQFWMCSRLCPAAVSARHFVATGDARQEVWLDNRDIPITFRTVENGTAIDFVLKSAAAGGTASSP